MDIIGGLLLGLLLADFLSGVLHWLEDRMVRESCPILGKYVVADNREHHRSPLAFTNTGFWYRNSTTMVAVAIIATPLLILFGPSVTLVTAAIMGSLSNEVHAWAHKPREAPKVVQLLQETGLLQSARHHGVHHRTPTRHYCVLTCMLNPILDHLRVWDRLEWMCAKVGLSVDPVPAG